jgi:hypothetical protein
MISSIPQETKPTAAESVEAILTETTIQLGDQASPSPGPETTRGPASPQEGRGEPCRTVILPRPYGGEAGANATACPP